MRKNILTVISIRNKYTHGTLVYDGGLKKFFIEYEEDGKKEAEVNDEIIKKDDWINNNFERYILVDNKYPGNVRIELS